MLTGATTNLTDGKCYLKIYDGQFEIVLHVSLNLCHNCMKKKETSFNSITDKIEGSDSKMQCHSATNYTSQSMIVSVVTFQCCEKKKFKLRCAVLLLESDKPSNACVYCSDWS